MAKTKPTIESEWQQFLKTAYAGLLPLDQDQHGEIKRAFYAGAFIMSTLSMSASKTQNADHVVDLICECHKWLQGESDRILAERN